MGTNPMPVTFGAVRRRWWPSGIVLLAIVSVLCAGGGSTANADTKCAALKQRYASDYLRLRLRCRTKSSAEACAAKAQAKLRAAFARAERAGSCAIEADAESISHGVEAVQRTLSAGLVAPGAAELCDNGLDDNGDTMVDCADLSCAADAACHQCGNGRVEPPAEQCEGADLDDGDCSTALGVPATGTLACAQDCSFDVSDCVPETP